MDDSLYRASSSVLVLRVCVNGPSSEARLGISKMLDLAALSTAQTMPRLEDVIANIYQIKGSVFQTIPQDLSNTIRSSE
jgi:hypothetical protein